MQIIYSAEWGSEPEKKRKEKLCAENSLKTVYLLLIFMSFSYIPFLPFAFYMILNVRNEVIFIIALSIVRVNLT